MASFNKIILVGYLGRDPELKYTGQGTAVCNVSIATTEKRKDAAGEQRDCTTWFRVTFWGRLAELCNEYLKKGSMAYVEGRLRTEEFTDREGQKRTSLEVNASEIQFLDRKSDGGGQKEEASTPADKHARREALHNTKPAEEEDDEIPF